MKGLYTMKEFAAKYPILTNEHAKTLINGPCIPAQHIGKKIINTPEKVSIKCGKTNSENNQDTQMLEIIDNFSKQYPTGSLHLFYSLPEDIKEAIKKNKIIEANDRHHVYLCNIFAKLTQKQKNSEVKSPYTKSYRQQINNEPFFCLSLTPTSNRKGRKLNSEQRACLVFQHYSVFDTMKEYSGGIRKDKEGMKKLREVIRNHSNNGLMQCPYTKKVLSEYPFEMPDIPLEAAEISITNRGETINESSQNIVNILQTRPLFKQLPGDPNLGEMIYEDLEKISLHDFKKTYML